jgi:chromosome segregation ATPase
MKALNTVKRRNLFLKFLLSGLAVMSLLSFTIYSYKVAGTGLSMQSNAVNEELDRLISFVNTTDSLVKKMEAAQLPTEKSNFVNQIQKSILDNKDNFKTTSQLYSKIDNQYQTILNKDNLAGQVPQKVDAIKGDFEEQVEDLKKQIDEQTSRNSDLKDRNDELRQDIQQMNSKSSSSKSSSQFAKSKLLDIANDVESTANSIANKDWCSMVGGKGSSEIKNELKSKMSQIKDQIKDQANGL